MSLSTKKCFFSIKVFPSLSSKPSFQSSLLMYLPAIFLTFAFNLRKKVSYFPEMVLTLLDVFTFKKCSRLQHAILSQTVIIFKNQFPVSKNRPHANTDQHIYLQTVLGKMLPKCDVLNSTGDIRPHIIRQNVRCFSSGIDSWRCLITDSPRRYLIGTSRAVIPGQRNSNPDCIWTACHSFFQNRLWLWHSGN